MKTSVALIPLHGRIWSITMTNDADRPASVRSVASRPVGLLETGHFLASRPASASPARISSAALLHLSLGARVAQISQLWAPRPNWLAKKRAGDRRKQFEATNELVTGLGLLPAVRWAPDVPREPIVSVPFFGAGRPIWRHWQSRGSCTTLTDSRGDRLVGSGHGDKCNVVAGNCSMNHWPAPRGRPMARARCQRPQIG